MIRSELVARIACRNSRLYQHDVENIVSTILGEIVAALERGDRVELRGFGIFSTKQRQARMNKNPRTGKLTRVDGKRFPHFKASKEMHGRLNATQDWKASSLPRRQSKGGVGAV
ncbi:HU family DNA-binding protein [Bradyrhizobium sp. CCGE-LA001]|uniref:HU family DNA-binding protein n=1 Tax=Bradyrhizobium sp. CCGE-LA001 TaxID=1223566 RepID=UPI0002AA7DF2|nr:HU family DNA-binding protein [Bradyrhizobium sp. CCGE-LA001]AMA59834.1 integration host factor subunit beta [Bradyrhizobium sp. CCGE-LA001]